MRVWTVDLIRPLTPTMRFALFAIVVFLVGLVPTGVLAIVDHCLPLGLAAFAVAALGLGWLIWRLNQFVGRVRAGGDPFL
jgi:hypothetical protein